MANKRTTHRHGFTIVELLVALTIFAIVVSVAVGGFVRALRIQRQLAAFVAANGNVSLAIEQMSREIRTGHDFSTPSAGALTFTNARGEIVTYALDDEHHTMTRQVGTGAPAAIVSETVQVTSLQFYLQFERSDDQYPTRVTIALVITPQANGLSTTAARLQTTVSARNLGT
jgi:prepilin-type N-terminal cleavage/methylation domain-containing protein